MDSLDEEHSHNGFCRHVGYGSSCNWSDEHAGEGIPCRGCREMIHFVVANGSFATETSVCGEHCE